MLHYGNIHILRQTTPNNTVGSPAPVPLRAGSLLGSPYASAVCFTRAVAEVLLREKTSAEPGLCLFLKAKQEGYRHIQRMESSAELPLHGRGTLFFLSASDACLPPSQPCGQSKTEAVSGLAVLRVAPLKPWQDCESRPHGYEF